jgi:hypothetical protein
MPLSWNTINTHPAGDVLPVADWNQAANALNGMVGTWGTTGSIASTATNGSPPFFGITGVFQAVTSGAGAVSVTFPNNGFPNNCLVCIPSLIQTTVGGSVQSGYTITAYQPGFSKTGGQFLVYAGSSAVTSTTVLLQYIAIGY